MKRTHPGISPGRPLAGLSERNAWLFAFAAYDAWKDGRPDVLVRVSPVERYRLNQRLKRWEDAAFSVPVLLALLANRADRLEFSASHGDIPELKKDPRIRPSGVSHPESGLLESSELEAYVRWGDVDALARDWFLVEAKPGQRANVVLHAADDVPNELPLLVVAADLAERSGAREQKAARELVRSIHAD